MFTMLSEMPNVSAGAQQSNRSSTTGYPDVSFPPPASSKTPKTSFDRSQRVANQTSSNTENCNKFETNFANFANFDNAEFENAPFGNKGKYRLLIFCTTGKLMSDLF